MPLQRKHTVSSGSNASKKSWPYGQELTRIETTMITVETTKWFVLSKAIVMLLAEKVGFPLS